MSITAAPLAQYFTLVTPLIFQQYVIFNCHLLSRILFYLKTNTKRKSNLLQIAKNNLRNLKVSQLGYLPCSKTDTVQHVQWRAINFSGKTILCLFWLYMSYISNSFDTNCTTSQASCARTVVFFFLKVILLFSLLCLNHLLQSFMIQLFLTSCPLLLFTYSLAVCFSYPTLCAIDPCCGTPL